MGVAHVRLVHRDPCECKVKGFLAVSSIERNVPKRRHLQRVRQGAWRGQGRDLCPGVTSRLRPVGVGGFRVT